MKLIKIQIADNGFLLTHTDGFERFEIYSTLQVQLMFQRILELTGDYENGVKVYKPREDYAVKSGMRAMTEWEQDVRQAVIDAHYKNIPLEDLKQPKSPECKVTETSSRVCERGTLACNVQHEPKESV